jgi:hypothetical protein
MKHFNWTRMYRGCYWFFIYDGVKKHKDGSEAADGYIAHNMREVAKYAKSLISQGYKED